MRVRIVCRADASPSCAEDMREETWGTSSTLCSGPCMKVHVLGVLGSGSWLDPEGGPSVQEAETDDDVTSPTSIGNLTETLEKHDKVNEMVTEPRPQQTISTIRFVLCRELHLLKKEKDVFVISRQACHGTVGN